MPRTVSGRIPAGELVREEIVPHVATSLCGGNECEGGGQIGAGCARHDTGEMDRVVIDLMARSATYANAQGTEGSAERAQARGLAVQHISYEIVLDNVISPARHADSIGADGRRVIVMHAEHLVSLE